MLLEEDISEELESSEAAEVTEEEEGEVVIDQLRFFVDISKAWRNVIHHNSPLETLISMREKLTALKKRALSTRAEKKTKGEKKAKKKSTKKTKSKKQKSKKRK